jgi:NTE family protein
MANSTRKKATEPTKVAIGCQGGGMHVAFAVGVLTKILEKIKQQKEAKDLEKRFELVGLSGTSAGALCALMVGYGLASKKDSSGFEVPGSEREAIDKLNSFWDNFVAVETPEHVLNWLTYRTLQAQEEEIVGINAPAFASLNPYGAIFEALTGGLPRIGVRREYFDLENMLEKHCRKFGAIDWKKAKARVLIGASEVINGFETVFDSNVDEKQENMGRQPAEEKSKEKARYWRQRLPLSLRGIAASGTLPTLRKAEQLGSCYYWDGLYSMNPPVREFFEGVKTEEQPEEIWIIRINPQQWPHVPKTNKDIQDRQNELMGNLSLNKELDFIMTVNAWNKKYAGQFAEDHKHVRVRTIKMKEKTANNLSYSSKFDRSPGRMKELRQEGEEVAQGWLEKWENNTQGEYPEDAEVCDE